MCATDAVARQRAGLCEDGEDVCDAVSLQQAARPTGRQGAHEQPGQHLGGSVVALKVRINLKRVLSAHC